jgi:hypothetical protein
LRKGINKDKDEAKEQEYSHDAVFLNWDLNSKIIGITRRCYAER